MDKPQSGIASPQSAILKWQLLDSAFPSGSFAHSWGLEAAYQAGEVQNEGSLRRFLRAGLWQTGHAVLPLVTAAHRAPARLEELDALCDAFLTNTVANRASRVQGKALLTACVRIWPSASIEALELRARRLCGHQAPMSGAVLKLLGIPCAEVQQMTLFLTGRGVLAAAVRLGLVGPYRAQRLQHECATEIEAVLARCASMDESYIAHTAPVLDLLQSTQDRLYSRLFQS